MFTVIVADILLSWSGA